MQTGHIHQQSNDHASSKLESSADRVRDVVCGMSVDPLKSPHRTEYEGRAYYFCGAGCRTKFLADPQGYLNKPEAQASAPVHADAIYTCPMHPEVRQVGPGACPICGMALEPLVATADTGPNVELADMTRRFWVALVLVIPVVTLEMGRHLLGLDHVISQGVSNWLQLMLATPVVLWAGWPFLVRGWNSIVSRNLNMFTLIAMGTGVAWLYSVTATLAPGVFPTGFRDAHGAVAVYFEAAAVITVFVLLGQVLELRARESTGGAIRALLDLAPKSARRLRADDGDEEIPVADVAVGDRLARPSRRKRPGRRRSHRGNRGCR